jgi:sulfoxide reductase catalytic subunit YedY
MIGVIYCYSILRWYMASIDSYKSVHVCPSEITPEHVYRNRRQFLKTMGIVGAGALLAACTPKSNEAPLQETPMPEPKAGATTDELGNPLNTYDQITHYNNYYEFTTDKEGVAGLAKDFQVLPWEVRVDGLVNNPQTYAMEDLLKKFPSEERIYRMRCVEAWSMVIPWDGFPLSKLLKEADPKSNAKFVRFVSLFDPERMVGQKSALYPWPYQEGLRLDEAIHDLTILVTGLYGTPLPAQDGAPMRLVVPWKYGFKSIKAVVKIELVDYQPETLWSKIAPDEYGFYSNVNPNVPHPRWSQASERRIGETSRRPTLMFNGYAEQVAHLYEGMDLKINY